METLSTQLIANFRAEIAALKFELEKQKNEGKTFSLPPVSVEVPLPTVINVQKFAHEFLKFKDTTHEQTRADAEAYLCEEIKKLPSVSGINDGIRFDPDNSTKNKLIFTFGFHHMNENGYYDGWTYHKLIIVPDLVWGFKLTITGRDRNQIKEYLYQTFDTYFSYTMVI